ncbi:histidinol dehydrogenase [Peribacillus saganii]|uniref:Histidinol dehydrogenase n=1 Tax=Peribacillus saganii TaxID=2303992 RepID=A0A372LL85_9BACI|nr:histidinol dehydrogenase [Peribacillus saganii]RFU66982.1 histidinol dehydrogenase [Peribacillus saganii]
MEIEQLMEGISLKRSVESGTEEQRAAVKEILLKVRNEGDAALYELTKRFDGVDLHSLRITEKEINEALQGLSDEHLAIIREAAKNIKSFHEKQLRNSWISTDESGTMLGQKITPLDSVGVYVPGGTAAYPSSVLMNVLPAKAAGVKRIVMVTPPAKEGGISPAVLAAANIAGVTEIYSVGGAQAVAALAYGTETIERVDKIVGPGNIYVALAKREVFGDVDIDMIAGPSEIAVLADDTAIPEEVAADLLSQAEHDTRACSVLVTTSRELAEGVAAEVEKQLGELPREEIARAAIEKFGRIFVADSLEGAISAINELAPEHLEIITRDPMNVMAKIRHAGAIFLGRYSSEPVGDYFAGPNHVLPTNGTARFSSPLNVDDFQKKSSIIMYSEEAFKANSEKIAAFARLEGLEAHARAIEVRRK